MRVAFEIVGVPEVCKGIENGIARLQIAVYKQMRAEMLGLRNYTVQAHLSGPTGSDTVNQKSGALARSLHFNVDEQRTEATGKVGFIQSKTVPYARILNLGGTTRAHVIKAVNAKALAFYASSPNLAGESRMMTALGGLLIFRRLVHHPGSHFPARPMLYDAFMEKKAQIISNLLQAMENM